MSGTRSGHRRWTISVVLLAVIAFTPMPIVSAAAISHTRAPGALRSHSVLPSLRDTCFDRIPTKKKLVALTFDAGGGDGGVRKILRTLRAEGVPGTFFLTGRWAEEFPDQVAAIAAAGHVLGNHTRTHRKVSTLTTSTLRSELRSTNKAVRQIADRGTKPFFRFPYGAHTPRDVNRINDLGYACIQWSVDTAGWMGTSGGRSVASVRTRVMDELAPGEIVLMHVGQHPTDGSTLDADALASVIEAVRAKGYGFTTLRALLPTPRPIPKPTPTPAVSASAPAA